jgi:hypothetical protein
MFGMGRMPKCAILWDDEDKLENGPKLRSLVISGAGRCLCGGIISIGNFKVITFKEFFMGCDGGGE